MKFDIGAIFGQIVAIYAKLPLAQKIALPLIIAGSMGAIIFVTNWANRPDYQVLFSGLEEGDAAAVVENLKDKKIGFRLRDEGRTIEVTPPEIVHELRLELAGMGLPKGGSIGFELFNENSLGRTGFVERVTLIRALQGELERTISSIEAVRNVRVHITKPEKTVFIKRQNPPTASVLLRLKAGKELTKPQIKGIASLVASSVEGLTPENVSILDHKGNLLNEHFDKDEEADGTDVTKLDYQRRIETAYVQRIETMLTEILGPGRAVARVTADVDFSRYEREEEAYDPAGQVTRSERRVEEKAGQSAEGGVPGVLSNLSNEPGLLAGPDENKDANARLESVRNYEISRAISKTVSAAGKILKLSVAVLVDGQYVEIPTEEKDEAGNPVAVKHYKPLTTEMMRKIENLVKQAVGFDPTRGDIVTVENIQFFEPTDTLEDVLQRAEMQDMIFRGLSWVLPAVFTLLFFFIVLKPLINFLVNPTVAEVDLSRLLPAGIEELEAEMEAERSRLSVLPDRDEPAVDIEEIEALLSENSRLVKENPQQAALLIRYWLNEGRI